MSVAIEAHFHRMLHRNAPGWIEFPTPFPPAVVEESPDRTVIGGLQARSFRPPPEHSRVGTGACISGDQSGTESSYSARSMRPAGRIVLSRREAQRPFPVHAGARGPWVLPL